jgi:methionyl-tRNA synthetase
VCDVPVEGRALVEAGRRLPVLVDEALGRFDLAAAAEAIWSVVVEANRFVASTRPWELRKLADCDEDAARRLDAVLGLVLETIRTLTHELRPLLPDGAARIEQALETRDRDLGRTLFPKTPS